MFCCREVIDLIDDDEEDSVSLIHVSNSPIRAFTPISEARDCLIDFRNNRSKRARPRAGAKPGAKRRYEPYKD
ncbi:unnamed protein product [Knipowitschia caucasica]|uniref:Uncharacterized protein n=1 Tax=Knipowitschia caucasica TaxID=637954 RepID=A0AAV2JG56_KNICA